MLNVTELANQLAEMGRGRMAEWDAPDPTETEDISSNVVEAIDNFAKAVMPTLDTAGCLAFLASNPEFLTSKEVIPERSVLDTVNSMIRHEAVTQAHEAMRGDIEAYVAKYWPQEALKGFAP